MVNAVRSLALCACTLRAFIISGVDMGVFLLIPCLTVVRSSETVPLRHVPAQRSPYCDVLLDCSYGTWGHTLSVVLYCHEVIGAVSHRLPPLEIRRKSLSFGSRNMCCVSVRLNPSPFSRYWTLIFLSVVLYCHDVIGAVSHRLPPLEIRRKSHSFGSRHMRCVSVRLNPSPLSKY